MSAARAPVATLTLLLLSAGTWSADPDAAASAVDSVVQLDSGFVRGYLRPADDGSYYSYRGIPYASQPVGDLRFKAPTSPARWSGVLEAREEGACCPQTDVLYGRLRTPRTHSEACLFINVHVPHHPELDRPTGLPVLVFIHGGGFSFGSGNSDMHGPEYLVTKGVIIVTFNYRLGALGFLTFNSEELPGNLGLMDMVSALRWVRRNIAAFGGDPENVTLGGQSAGASAVHLLTVSPAARGLFHRAILMSGTSTRSWLSTSHLNGQRLAETLLLKLNIEAVEPSERLRQLRTVSLERIVQAEAEIMEQEGIASFVPVVEQAGHSRLLPEDPYVAVEQGHAMDIPLLIGYTDGECHTFARRMRSINLPKMIRVNPGVLVPLSLIFSSSPDRLSLYIASIKERYFPNEDADEESVLQQYLRYCSDSYFIYPAVKLAQLASKRNSAPVFLYEFAYRGHYSPIKTHIGGKDYDGAVHIEDMTYLLRTNSYPHNITKRAADDWAKKWMNVMFANYIKTGHPTPTSYGGELVSWPPYNEGGGAHSLVLHRSVDLAQHKKDPLLDFFDQLYSGGGGDQPISTSTPAAERRNYARTNNDRSVALQNIDLHTHVDD